MQFKWVSCLSFALATGCNWLAGIDARETAQAAGGDAGAIVGGGPSGHGGVGGSSSTAHGGLGDAGSGGTDAGAGGAAGDEESGGAPGSGGAEASGGNRASTGGAGASAGGGAAQGGSGGTGGAGGATRSVECRPGFTSELETDDWDIDTGIPMGGNSGWIEPRPYRQGDLKAPFEGQPCVCVKGTRSTYADLHFTPKTAALHFNTLNIRLISAPNLVIPTIYVHVQGEDKKHCMALSKEESEVTQGTPLQLQSTDFLSDSDCNVGSPDLAANSLIDAIYLQFADYGGKTRKDFDLCVLSLTVQ